MISYALYHEQTFIPSKITTVPISSVIGYMVIRFGKRLFKNVTKTLWIMGLGVKYIQDVGEIDWLSDGSSGRFSQQLHRMIVIFALRKRVNVKQRRNLLLLHLCISTAAAALWTRSTVNTTFFLKLHCTTNLYYRQISVKNSQITLHITDSR